MRSEAESSPRKDITSTIVNDPRYPSAIPNEALRMYPLVLCYPTCCYLSKAKVTMLVTSGWQVGQVRRTWSPMSDYDKILNPEICTTDNSLCTHTNFTLHHSENHQVQPLLCQKKIFRGPEFQSDMKYTPKLFGGLV